MQSAKCKIIGFCFFSTFFLTFGVDFTPLPG